MSPAVPAAREAFVASMKRDTKGAELNRLVAVLDALIKWSVARPQALRLRADSAVGLLAFDYAESKALCWSARVTRGDAPKLELYPPTGRSFDADTRAKVMETFNAHARDVLDANDRLRIGFGALKNSSALAAVTALLGELVAANSASAKTQASVS